MDSYWLYNNAKWVTNMKRKLSFITSILSLKLAYWKTWFQKPMPSNVQVILSTISTPSVSLVLPNSYFILPVSSPPWTRNVSKGCAITLNIDFNASTHSPERNVELLVYKFGFVSVYLNQYLCPVFTINLCRIWYSIIYQKTPFRQYFLQQEVHVDLLNILDLPLLVQATNANDGTLVNQIIHTLFISRNSV